MSHDHKSHDSKLFYMANQIGKFFGTNAHDAAVDGIADHIAKFWEPRMRQKAYALMATEPLGLDPLPREALERLQKKDAEEAALAK